VSNFGDFSPAARPTGAPVVAIIRAAAGTNGPRRSEMAAAAPGQWGWQPQWAPQGPLPLAGALAEDCPATWAIGALSSRDIVVPPQSPHSGVSDPRIRISCSRPQSRQTKSKSGIESIRRLIFGRVARGARYWRTASFSPVTSVPRAGGKSRSQSPLAEPRPAAGANRRAPAPRASERLSAAGRSPGAADCQPGA
jgi:hypothetical protein